MTISINQSLTIPDSTELIMSAGEGIAEIPLSLTDNARTVLAARYLKKDDDGVACEEPEELFRRVAKVVAGAEDLHGNTALSDGTATVFYNLMVAGEFMPNSPTLMNAGRDLGQLSACFVLQVDDSMDSIFQAVKDAAIIHKSGGGTGFSFSRLRPRNDVVKTTRGVSSGPVSFMSVFDTATETIKQGGTRRGANMGILRVDHPDIRDFISCKRDGSRLANFNISVAVTDTFMTAVAADSSYDLINPHTGMVAATESARDIFGLLVENAHAVGDPGIIFIDRINEHNPLPHLGVIESTNPCGEQPLLPYESCNLGSLNLGVMVATDEDDVPVIDWPRLGRTVRLAVRFLDNVIDVNKYPLDLIGEETRRNRKIGLGVMGFADMLIRLGIPYGTEEAEHTAEAIMGFVNTESTRESRHLAELRGAFSTFEGSVYDRAGEPPLRNATTTTIAPTGSISIIVGCSSGIEPLFALAYERNVLDGEKLAEFHHLFRDQCEAAGILDDTLRSEVLATGSVGHLPTFPEPLRRLFSTSREIPVDWHIRLQAAFQRHTDNAVSKTINIPENAVVQDVAEAYQTAWKTGLKGITIYRDGSRAGQVLTTGDGKQAEIPTAPDTAVQTAESRNLEPRPRPPVTRGTTEKLVTGCGNLYVTVNQDDTGLCEVFCQMGRSGGCTSSQSEAISRLISLALRSGVKLDEIVSQLKGIRCPSSIWHNGSLILSCSDAIATSLTRYLDIEEDDGNTTVDGIPIFNPDADSEDVLLSHTAGKRLTGEMAGVCPDCGGVLEYTEGCVNCRSCGFTRCG